MKQRQQNLKGKSTASALTAVLLSATATACAQTSNRGAEGAARQTDQAVGQRFEVKAESLPPPDPKSTVDNATLVVPRGDRIPRTPRSAARNTSRASRRPLDRRANCNTAD